MLPVWGGVGLIIYFLYSRNHSHVGKGHVEVHEDDADAPHNSSAAAAGVVIGSSFQQKKGRPPSGSRPFFVSASQRRIRRQSP